MPVTVEVRRGWWAHASNLIIGVTLIAISIVTFFTARAHGEALTLPFVAAVAGVGYAWFTIGQILDKTPVLIIAPDGLAMPGVSPAPIPWDHVHKIGMGGLFAAGQLSLDVEPEHYKVLKLGSRFLGDAISKRRGIAPGIIIQAHGLDHDAKSILQAMRRHWPPPEIVET